MSPQLGRLPLMRAGYLCVVPAAMTLIAPVALAGLRTPCGQAALQRLAPASPFAMTITSARPVAAESRLPEYCDVKGSIEAHKESAGFEVWLPMHWNLNYLQYGCGGFCGSVGLPHFSYAQSNADAALQQGYAVAATDDGHRSKGGFFDASWVLGPNGTEELAEFAYQGVHHVSMAMKEFVRNYYSRAITDSYFDGCSDGGREALKEAEMFPKDFNGIIAGDPYLDSRYAVQNLKADRAFLAPPGTGLLPQSAFALIDRAVYANCDRIDGVKDDLIQNPSACSFRPKSLLCGAHGNTPPNCLTAAQVVALTTYLRPVMDEHGRIFIEGQPMTDLETSGAHDVSPEFWFEASMPKTFVGPEPWGSFDESPPGWQFPDATLKYLVYRDPNYNALRYPLASTGMVDGRALAQLVDHDVISADHPREILSYLSGGGKLLMYDGLSDGVFSPYPTMRMFEQVAALAGGFVPLSKSGRLFEVPGMHHCGGGPGPNSFDVLTAMNKWVRDRKAPDSIVATHFDNNSGGGSVDRTMPLCAFPTEATYMGGPVNEASSWSCARNTRMLEAGYDGKLAGMR
jgi:feruloyl esterase